MAMSRRAFGVGLLAASAAATGGYIYLRGHPEIAGRFGEAKRLFGFAGGEKEGFLANARVRNLLERRFGLVLDARRAGSVEMVRERTLLDQKPQFLWPSSSVLVEVARSSGVKISRDQVIFNSPIVLYSWDRIADGLVKAGFAESAGGPRYTVDLLKLLKAIIAGQSWADIGVSDLFGRARVVSTDPNRSNSGFMFAGLVASVLSGDLVMIDTLGRVDGDVATVFRRMGFKPPSSGKLFDDYVSGGVGAQPLIVGYENQLVEWVLQDADRWKRVEANAPAKPVILYPRPTVFSAHPLISINREADDLIDALVNESVLELAWEDHGFRGPLGTIGKARNALLQSRLIDRVDAVLPMPDAPVMLALLDRLAA
ncbi:hypothetical protein JQ557_16660 [Bradyrhizobium sp. U87765 SZCCT0131]|uniref:hypothetical protein n=1 Tax=unclassified Bradyrhizobium TaxID=2631580 RepID=UPI001BA651A4|nr:MULTISPECIES: hypothetical protein [unclassified Bradyrhizobium]MBR1219640.1 hypothetical protein [Bradyrhizobium sp. U87765 SZCCT0131]MBR1262291.1 hypothetical protein [Bradyrhizobium sp. U87765 SZCCT0134]MBR1308526.1 hypothetical protein [Bradyrhizobium sp. U87765 SZCCT0110]MBR1318073.1 hypothetical protein [Bradyrhizobium sp. U87765 SZCCT0109]MBR1351776.1 hypothetical protein [Bradyrhizobium sp. U87765 SZCCT0048]